MRSPRKFIEISISKVVQVTENHGGYLGASCLACGASGWLDGAYGYSSKAKGVMSNRLIHKPGCAMNQHALRLWTGGQ